MSPSYSIYMDRLNGLLKPRFVAADPILLGFAEKDFEYCSKRFSAEGIRFLTVNLPSLRKALDLSFKTGRLEVPAGFSKVKGTGLPVFLYSHFSKIYHPDGSLFAMPYVTRIKHVRQVCEAFYKLELPYSPALEAATLDNFVANEAAITSFLDSNQASALNDQVVSGAALLCRYVFSHFPPKDIVPRHGPGSLATGEKGEEKWKFSRLYSSIHQQFPYYEYFFHNTNMLGDLKGDYMSLDRLNYGVSKITLVPKDSRGPRIITMEPLEYMWIQQGLGRKMMHWLEANPLTKGRINFFNQKVNQDLARRSSLTLEFATLDMKDASDLLSVKLVEKIFRLKPSILKCLLAARTPETVLPNGTVVPLKKFAGMGSALCFPVESFVFWALSVSAIAIKRGIGLHDAAPSVYVFGDDIIVPTEDAEDVIRVLSSVGLKVNTDKSYYQGWFRESCGVDAFGSFDVTPTRFKKTFPVTSEDGTGFAAWVAYANAFESKGYSLLANSIYEELEKVFGKIPYGVPTSPFPCKIVNDPALAEELNQAAKFKWRVSKDYQRVEFRVRTLVPITQDSQLDGWARFNRDILSGTGDEPSIFTLPRATRVVRGWMAV